MNNLALKTLNLVVLLAIIAAVPFGIRAYKPIEDNNKAVELLQNKQYDQAIALLTTAMEKEPTNDTFRKNLLAAYNSKAIELEKRGNDAEALASYEKAIQLDGSNQLILKNYISTLNNLAVARSKTQSFSESQKLFERASKTLGKITDPAMRDEVRHNYSALLTLWGAELFKRDQVDAAQASFEQSIELNSTNSIANIYLGDLHYERNQYAKARKYYTAAMPFDKDNKDYLTNRLQMIEDESKVEGLFKEARDSMGHFTVQYVQYNEGVSVTELLQILEEARTEIGKKLGIYPARAVSVKIYDSNDFHKISHLPEWAIGIFDGKMRLDVQHVQSAHSQVRDLLFHEYTHAVLAMNVKHKVPAWFHEGLAQLMEPQFAENTREQAQMIAALSRGHFDFASIQNSFKDITSKQDAETAYLVSKYYFASLNSRFGPEKLLAWVRGMASDKPFDVAFKDAYGEDLAKSQEDWIAAQKKVAPPVK